MVMGLTFYQFWYSTIPKEIQLRDLNEFYSPRQSDMFEATKNLYGNSEGHNAVNSHVADTHCRCDSKTSVMNKRDISVDADSHLHRKVSVEVNVDLQREDPLQNFQPRAFYVNSAEDTGDEAFSLVTVLILSMLPFSPLMRDWIYGCCLCGCHTQPRILRTSSICIGKCLMSIIEMQLSIYGLLFTCSLGSFTSFVTEATWMMLDLYMIAIAAFVNMSVLLLIGDQVNEALNELEKFCCNLSTSLPISVMLSTCYEDILKKDPTCCHALTRLVNMHHNGDYSPEPLLEMIALHLDATYAEDCTWREFALCFLKLSQYEEDRMSVCVNGNEDRCRYHAYHFNRTLKMLTEDKSGKAWRFRCKWWLTRHFSKKMLESEITSGDFQLLTYKAACASHMYGKEFESHMYGKEFEYVVKAYTCLEKENNRGVIK